MINNKVNTFFIMSSPCSLFKCKSQIKFKGESSLHNQPVEYDTRLHKKVVQIRTERNSLLKQ